MTNTQNLAGWARVVGLILGGQRHRFPYVRIGPTPPILRKYGLGPRDLAITPGKILRVAKEHPEITREIWLSLPKMLQSPVAIVPSSHGDGSIVPVLAFGGGGEGLLLVPVLPARDIAFNLVLSVYARTDGLAWLNRELGIADQQGKSRYLERGFAATLPQPGSASENAIPSSSGSIPVDGTAKPKREILRLRKKSTES